MTDRSAQMNAFLKTVDWGTAKRQFLAGDASERKYDRLYQNGRTAVLMDAPPGQGDSPAVFLAIARHLNGLGLSAPHCFGADLQHGFLLLEDLGDNVYAKLINKDATLENRLYTAATSVLAHLQAQPSAENLPNLSATEWADAACFALDWYRFGITGERITKGRFRDALTDALVSFADAPRVMILRDYHAENLIWLPDRTGLAQVGLLDFQLAQLGQPGYDLVSLLQDARRDVSPDVEQIMIRHFLSLTGADEARFRTSYSTLGAQRALRILGIFAKLCLNGGKPGYVALIPRVWGQLQQNLAAPELSRLATICAELLPKPTPEALARIGSQCGHFR